MGAVGHMSCPRRNGGRGSLERGGRGGGGHLEEFRELEGVIQINSPRGDGKA